MKAAYSGVWQVHWGNPTRTRHDGQPDILAEVVIANWADRKSNQPPAELVAIANANPGYSVAWGARMLTPRRTMSQEAKSRIRKGRLEKRMRAKYPMLADLLIQETLAAKPDYYAARDPQYDGVTG